MRTAECCNTVRRNLRLPSSWPLDVACGSPLRSGDLGQPSAHPSRHTGKIRYFWRRDLMEAEVAQEGGAVAAVEGAQAQWCQRRCPPRALRAQSCCTLDSGWAARRSSFDSEMHPQHKLHSSSPVSPQPRSAGDAQGWAARYRSAIQLGCTARAVCFPHRSKHS